MTPSETHDEPLSKVADSTSQKSSESNTSGHSENSSHEQIKPPRHTASRTPTQKPHVRRTHTRSLSHTKMPTRLSTSGPKPHLNRSKSSDIIRTQRQPPGIKRNNRSFNKVPGFLPLKKTILNGSTKGPVPLNRSTLTNSLKGMAPLRKTMLNGSTKDKHALQKSHLNTSMRSSKSLNSLKGLNSFTNGSSIGLRLSSKRGRAIVKLNEDAESNEYEDLSEDSELESNERQLNASNDSLNQGTQTWAEQERIIEAPEPTRGSLDLEEDQSRDDLRGRSTRQVDHSHGTQYDTNPRNEGFAALENPHIKDLKAVDQAKSISEPPVSMSSNSSTDELMNNNIYGGSLLLSQSTGITRKIGEPVGYRMSEQSSDDRLDQKMKDERISGISFKARPYNEVHAEPQQAKPAASVSSYQPDQTIFSNLQRNNSKYLSNLKSPKPNQPAQQSQSALQANAASGKDFSNFLNSSHSSNGAAGHAVETRTQQRLWLQRENSLMDVSQNHELSHLQNFSNMSLNKLMFAHNYNSSTTNVREPSRKSGPQTPRTQGGATFMETEGSGSGEQTNVTNLFYLIQSGHQQGSVRSRTEYERLNREYLNVRRHLNPVAESLNRMEKYYAQAKGLNVQKNAQASKGAAASIRSQVMNANKFENFVANAESREAKASLLVNKVWQDALIRTTSSSPSVSRQGEQSDSSGSFYNNPQQIQQRLQPMRPSRSSGNVSQRSSVTPTTRAVKLATQASGEGYSSQR